jgi:hypothetical protein
MLFFPLTFMSDICHFLEGMRGFRPASPCSPVPCTLTLPPGDAMVVSMSPVAVAAVAEGRETGVAVP